MDWIVPFRWARSRQSRNPESLRFAACACSCALPHRARSASIRVTRPAGYPTFAVCGFTLIEMLIVLAVVAILAAIALPSYQAQIRKGHRAAAQSYMMDLAQREAQYLLDARAYASTAAALGYTATPADVARYYTIGIAAPVVSPPAFTITATAIGAQVADGNLTIDNQGTKTPSGKW
jgi:type IV pilus assembly protein PilE